MIALIINLFAFFAAVTLASQQPQHSPSSSTNVDVHFGSYSFSILDLNSPEQTYRMAFPAPFEVLPQAICSISDFSRVTLPQVLSPLRVEIKHVSRDALEVAARGTLGWVMIRISYLAADHSSLFLWSREGRQLNP